MTDATTLWTIGHGSRSLEEFLVLLREAGIRLLVDVRAYPGSRRHPHFARTALEKSLAAADVSYLWEGPALGGRRSPHPISPHLSLTDPQFRAYADHMATPAFREALERLVRRGHEGRTAVMCAERLPSECHRSFISDMLVARGVTVRHIVGTGAATPHELNPLARRTEHGMVYDIGVQLPLGS